MNEVFDIKRFGYLAARYYRENWKRNVAYVSLLAVCLFLALTQNPFSVRYIAVTSVNSPEIANNQQAFYWFMLLVFSVFYSATGLREYRRKTTAVAALTLPASTLEKYLLGVLNVTVVFFAVYTLVFYAVDFIVLQYHTGYFISDVPQIFNSLGDLHMTRPDAEVFRVELANVFAFRGNSSWVLFGMVCFILFTQAAFLWGSLVFKRNVVVFTTLIHLLILLGLGLLISPLVEHWESPSSFGYINMGASTLELQTYITSSYWLLGCLAYPVAYLAAVFLQLKRRQA